MMIEKAEDGVVIREIGAVVCGPGIEGVTIVARSKLKTMSRSHKV